jgi:hypothetical protein
MPDVGTDDQGLVQEYVLGLFRSDVMGFPILLNIRVVPIKARTVIKRVVAVSHNNQYTMDIYTTRMPWHRLFWARCFSVR